MADLDRRDDGKRIDQLDFLRGIAILAVVAFHTMAIFPSSNPVLRALALQGYFGVQLFFLVSALTMCAMWERRNAETSPILKFYIRRLFRIAGPFWLATIFYLWLGGLRHDTYEIGPAQIISTLLLAHSIWPTWINSIVPGGWSIGVEVIFYAFFPFLIQLNRGATFYLIFGFAVYLVNTLIVLPLWTMALPIGIETSDFLNKQFFNQAPIFLIGIYLFQLLRCRSAPSIKDIVIATLWIAGAFTLKKGFGYQGAPMFWLALVFIATSAFIVILKKISWWPINRIGQVSYSMYLSHFAVLHFLHGRGGLLALRF